MIRTIEKRQGFIVRAGQNIQQNRIPGGFVVIDGQVKADGMQCGHCGGHWIVQPGSGIQRGFCLKCARVTCGGAECERECVPYEKRLDLYEKGLRDHI